MGKSLFYLLVFILLSLSFVQAGESFDVDFTAQKSQAVFLHEKDEARFSLLGGDHVLIIDDVGSSSIKVDFGPFMNSTNTELHPGIIGLDYIMRLDLDKNGVTDVNIALYSVSADGVVHLVFQDVSSDSGEIPENIGLVDNGSTSGGFGGKSTLLLFLGVIILAVVLFLVFRNVRPEKKEENFRPKEHHSASSSHHKEEGDSVDEDKKTL